MREILFRGKNITTGEWEIGDLVHMFKEVPYIHRSYGKGEIYREIDPDTIGQYTEQEDINGEKIFEGDIFKLSTWYGEDLGIVCWDEERAEFYIETKKDFYDVVSIPSETEILGNIWDNPEMIREINGDNEE